MIVRATKEEEIEKNIGDAIWARDNRLFGQRRGALYGPATIQCGWE